jgi:hypothetical protein
MKAQDRCLDVEDLGEVDSLDPGDPRWKHAQGCTRCRTLLSEYRSFMEPASEAHAPRIREAESRISFALDQELGRPGARPPGDSPREGAGFSIRELLTGAWRRPAWAIAAALMVVTAGVTWNLLQQDEGEHILRGDTEAPSAVRGLDPRSLIVEPQPNGALELRWTGVDQADSYRIVLMSPTTLEDIAVLEPAADTLYILLATDLPATVNAGDVLLWRVEAMREGDVIGTSSTVTLETPSRP